MIPIQYALRRRMMGQTSLLPSGYIQVEWIEGTGIQYIDTEVPPTADLVTEIQFTPSTDGLSENAILGSTWALNGYFLMFYQNNVRYHSGGKSVDISTFNASDKNTIICSYNSVIVNGITYPVAATTTNSTDTIYLFSTHNPSGGLGKYKLHYCKMTNSGGVLHEFIPCYRVTDGIGGIYDTVTKTFYTTLTGTFGYPEKPASTHTVALQGEFSATWPYCYVTIKGIQYTSTQVITVSEGESVSVTVATSSSGDSSDIYDNRGSAIHTTVEFGVNNPHTYTFTVTSNTKIQAHRSGTGWSVFITNN